MTNKKNAAPRARAKAKTLPKPGRPRKRVAIGDDLRERELDGHELAERVASAGANNDGVKKAVFDYRKEWSLQWLAARRWGCNRFRFQHVYLERIKTRGEG